VERRAYCLHSRFAEFLEPSAVADVHRGVIVITPLRNVRRRSLLSTSLMLAGQAWAVAVVLAGAALAQPAGNGGAPTPPAESLAACKSLSAGQACSFTGARGAVSGTCFAPQGRELACRPSNAPPPPGGAAASGPAAR
jgi:hypothetical protein